MARSTTAMLIAVLVIAALIAPALAQVAVTRRPSSLRAQAAKFGKKGTSSSRCSIGAPTLSMAADKTPVNGVPDHPFNPSQATFFINNQAKPRLLPHLSTTFDCVDSRCVTAEIRGAAPFFLWSCRAPPRSPPRHALSPRPKQCAPRPPATHTHRRPTPATHSPLIL
jgi:hypothetical protein